ncbi:MAG: ABC transporter ATP-binding protein [Bacilli bacterium]
MFFRPINLINDLTAEENVELARLNKNCLSAKEALSLMDLSDKFEAYPDELSGGQKQRVSIARAIVKKPTILLCDEPTGALDYQSGKLVLSYLEKLVKEQSQTIVLVTHTRAIGDMADRVIVMRNGQIEDTIINDNPLSADKVNW